MCMIELCCVVLCWACMMLCPTYRLCISQETGLWFVSLVCPFYPILFSPLLFCIPQCAQCKRHPSPLWHLWLSIYGPWTFHLRNKIQTQRELLVQEKNKIDANMAREKNELSVQLIDLARREAGLKIQINDFKRLQGTVKDENPWFLANAFVPVRPNLSFFCIS